MKKVVAIVLGILGIILVLAGLGLITLSLKFLLYFGAALLLVALFFFLIN